MTRSHFRSPLRKYALCLWLAGSLIPAVQALDPAPAPAPAPEIEPPLDPGLQISVPELTIEQAKTCRKFFEQLGNPDFDVREQALNRIVAFGSAALPLAAEFIRDPDPEIASQARGLKDRILFSFDGYLPTDPALLASLKKSLKYDVTLEKPMKEVFAEIVKSINLPIVIDPHVTLGAFPDIGGAFKLEGMASEILSTLLRFSGLVGVPRGNTYLITTPDVAQRLMLQRRNFEWSDLGLSRDEADSVGKVIQPFFTPVTTELHTGSEVLTLRGEEGCFPRAARLIALMKPGAPDGLWPLPKHPANAVGVLDRLSAPGTLALVAQDPLDALDLLKKQKHEVFVLAKDGQALQAPPFPGELGGFSPLRIGLHNLPLGLILRWVERRARISAAEQANHKLIYDIDPSGRIQFFLRPGEQAHVIDWPVCGADATFLYPKGAKPGASADAAARAVLLGALESHLALYPAIVPDRDIVILRGRLLMQGPYATLARTLELIREWRTKRQPPAPAAWRTSMEKRLAASIDWDGRAMTGGRVISALRTYGKVDILLEEAADGSPPDFKLAAEDAQLLPPGKHSLRELLDDLCKKAGGKWNVELGVIVLTAQTK